jgi:hypothetical protein
VQPGPGRQGYSGKKSDLPTFVYKTKNKENPYQVMKDKKHQGQFKSVEEAEEFIKEKGWTKGKQWSAHNKAIKENIENIFDEMFQDLDKSADDLINPTAKIREKTGYEKRLIKKILDDYPPAQDMKQVFTRLSRPAFVKKVMGEGWSLADVISAVETKSASTRALNPVDRIMENAARHYAQAEPGKSLIQFYDNKNNVITDLKNIDIYKDDIYFKYRDDSTKPFKAKKYGLQSSLEDVVDIARTGRQEPLLKEYWTKVDELTDLKNKPVWDDLTPDLQKVFAKKGNKTTFGDVMRYAYNQGSGYSMKYLPYSIDHKSGVGVKPFSDLRVIPRRINQAAGLITQYRPAGSEKYLKKIGYLFDKDMKTLIRDELKLANDILVPSDKYPTGRKLNSPYQIAREAVSGKTIPKFKPKISGGPALHSFPANLPRMWKMMGSGARKALGWATGLGSEVVFFYWDKANEMSKGKTEEEAAGIAANNATFGIYPNKKYLPELKKVAEDMGINPQAFEKVYFLNEQMAKVQKQDAQYQQRIELIKKMPGDPERKAEALAGMEEAYANWQKGMTSQIEKWSEDVAGQIAISKTKLPKPSLDQIAEERYNITDEDWMKPFIDIQNVALEKLEREKRKAYDVQSKLADPESGSKYKWLTNLFTGTEDFWGRTKGQEKQRLIDDMIEKGGPGELYRYNLYERGISPDSPVSKEALENLQYEHPGLGLGMAGGGIASIRRPWAIPPESGPDPQGLASLNNYATKRTE